MPKLNTSIEAKNNYIKCDDKKIKKQIYKLGRYKIEYDFLELPYYGSGSYKGYYDNIEGFNYKINFYEDDILIDNSVEHSMCHEIIIGGDGLSRDTTYYLLPPTSGKKGDIFDFNDKFIRNVYEAGDNWYGTFRGNDNYCLTMCYNVCTHHIFIGLYDIKKLFDISLHSKQERPYENSRLGLNTDNDGDYFIVEFNEEGCIFDKLESDDNDIITIEYDKYDDYLLNQDYSKDSFYILSYMNDGLYVYLKKIIRKSHKLVKYENVEDFIYSNDNDNDNDIISNNNSININDYLKTKSGCLCISFT